MAVHTVSIVLYESWSTNIQVQEKSITYIYQYTLLKSMYSSSLYIEVAATLGIKIDVILWHVYFIC